MGRIPGRRKWEPLMVARARASVKDEMEAIVEQSNAELSTFTRMRLKWLEFREQVLDLPNKLEDFSDVPDPHLAQNRRLRLQLDVANAYVSDAITVDDQAFRAQQHEGTMALLARRVAEV